MDMIFEVDQLPHRPEKFIASDVAMVGGGGAANAAVALARLQAVPMLLARVGDDDLGVTIGDELQASGVDCSLLQISQAGRSSISSVLVDRNGERQIVNFRGSGLSAQVPPLNALNVDAVLADMRWPAATRAALKLAKDHGVPGVLDAEAPVDVDSVQLASHVAFSAQGLRSYSGVSGLDAALLAVAETMADFVCVTDGENGVLFIEDGKVKHLPACMVQAVDTLGAGDVWHAAFVFQLAVGESEIEAMRFANVAAAIKCTRKGGGRQSPTLSEINHFIN